MSRVDQNDSGDVIRVQAREQNDEETTQRMTNDDVLSLAANCGQQSTQVSHHFLA
jgi:hypothetical protein